MSKSQTALSKGALAVYRSIVLATCGVFLWLQSTFVGSREFSQHKGEELQKWTHHDSLRDETLQRLINDTKRVESKIDRIETLLLNRQRADAANAAMGKRQP